MIHGGGENKYRLDMRVSPKPMALLGHAIGDLAMAVGPPIVWRA